MFPPFFGALLKFEVLILIFFVVVVIDRTGLGLLWGLFFAGSGERCKVLDSWEYVVVFFLVILYTGR
jgi:hypothetical protein